MSAVDLVFTESVNPKQSLRDASGAGRTYLRLRRGVGRAELCLPGSTSSDILMREVLGGGRRS